MSKTNKNTESDDFYFKCATLNCTLLASSCGRNRGCDKQHPILLKNHVPCSTCTSYSEYQSIRVEVEPFHTQVALDSKVCAENKKRTSLVEISPKDIYSDWRGKGRSRTRIN